MVWVDALVPRDAPVGEYHGAARVTSDRGAVSIPVKLTVWNFELPVKPSLKSIFGLQNAIGRNGIEEILRHRITPRISPATWAEKAMRDRELIDRYGLSLIDVGFWSGADRSNCNMRRAPPESDFRRAARNHDSDLMLINYTADEIDGCPHLHAPLKQWARSMHDAGIRNLVVMKPTPDLFDDGSGTGRPAVDIWVVLPVMFDDAREQIAAALARGHEVWSYSTLVQDPYSPKWLIDFEPINLRIQAGFLSQSLNLTGLLYWRMDEWRSDPWSSTNNSGVYGSGNYPGEGVLVYPGAPAGVSGVVPSIRLKQLRDGLEDYEYVEILKTLGRGDWAREVAGSVAADWKRWTRSAADLLAARKKLGEEIHRRSVKAGSL